MVDVARARKLAVRIREVVSHDARDAGQGPAARHGHDHRRQGHARPARGDALLHGLRQRRGAARAARWRSSRPRACCARRSGKQTGVRYTPSLQFIADVVPETAGRIEELLAQARAADAQVHAHRRERRRPPARPTRTARPAPSATASTTRTSERAAPAPDWRRGRPAAARRAVGGRWPATSAPTATRSARCSPSASALRSARHGRRRLVGRRAVRGAGDVRLPARAGPARAAGGVPGRAGGAASRSTPAAPTGSASLADRVGRRGLLRRRRPPRQQHPLRRRSTSSTTRAAATAVLVADLVDRLGVPLDARRRRRPLHRAGHRHRLVQVPRDDAGRARAGRPAARDRHPARPHQPRDLRHRAVRLRAAARPGLRRARRSSRRRSAASAWSRASSPADDLKRSGARPGRRRGRHRRAARVARRPRSRSCSRATRSRAAARCRPGPRARSTSAPSARRSAAAATASPPGFTSCDDGPSTLARLRAALDAAPHLPRVTAPDGLLVVDKPAGWTSPRRRRPLPPAGRHPQGRPRRHARPDGHRRARARRRPGHPAARPPRAHRQGATTRPSGSAPRPSPTTPRARSSTTRDASAVTDDAVARRRWPRSPGRSAAGAVVGVGGQGRRRPVVRPRPRRRAGRARGPGGGGVALRAAGAARRRPRRRGRVHLRDVRPGARPRPRRRARRRRPPDGAAPHPRRARSTSTRPARSSSTPSSSALVPLDAAVAASFPRRELTPRRRSPCRTAGSWRRPAPRHARRLRPGRPVHRAGRGPRRRRPPRGGLRPRLTGARAVAAPCHRGRRRDACVRAVADHRDSPACSPVIMPSTGLAESCGVPPTTAARPRRSTPRRGRLGACSAGGVSRPRRRGGAGAS